MGSAESPAVEAVDRYGRLVMRIAWWIVKDREEARDIYQETFLRFHAAWSSGQNITSVKAWLCRTAMNAALNRQRQRNRELAFDPEAEGFDRARPASTHEAEKSLLIAEVRSLVDRLPDRQREVFVLRNFEGLSFAEISEILACSVEAARASEYQALQKIRAGMNSHQDARKVKRS